MDKQVEIREQCDRSERLSTLSVSHDKQETCNLVISENITKHGEDGKAGEEDTQTTLIMLGQRKPIDKVGSQPDKKLVNINASLCQDNDDTMDLSNTCQGKFSFCTFWRRISIICLKWEVMHFVATHY